MSQRLRKFISRAPRYVLRPSDPKEMRFSLENTTGAGAVESTILLDLSETGVAFLMNPGTELKMRERVKVQIPIPNGEQIAWWAEVVRVEVFEPRNWLFQKDPFAGNPKVRVALKFDHLPEQHTRAIRKGIEQSLVRAMRDQQYRTWVYYKDAILKTILYLALTAFLVGFIYWFSLPDSKYDAKRGTPWGDRFKFF